MIRKVLLGLFLLYSILWLFIGYILKQEISGLTTREYDNLALACDDIEISGFPSNWQFIITNPVVEVKSTDSTQIISSQSLKLTLNLGVNVIKLEPSSEVLVEVKTNDIPVLYKVAFSGSPRVKFKLQYPLFWGYTKPRMTAMSIAIPGVSVSADQEMVSINDTVLELKSTKSDQGEIVAINTRGEYEGLEEFLGFNFMQFELGGEVEYSRDEVSNKTLMRRITIDNLDIVVDDDVALGVTGSLLFAQDNLLPSGSFNVLLQNYPGPSWRSQAIPLQCHHNASSHSQ